MENPVMKHAPLMWSAIALISTQLLVIGEAMGDHEITQRAREGLKDIEERVRELSVAKSNDTSATDSFNKA